MRQWLRAFTIYTDPRVISVFFLGFSSGLPFLLILATFSVWLAESGISKTQIGVLAWVTIPYSLKFVWAPLIDHIEIPFICRLLGKRRGWMLTSQLFLMVSLIMLGLTDPATNMLKTIFWAFMVGMSSATQDVVIEAFRIEILPRNRTGYGAGASVLGYRVGMLISGAGALYLAAYFKSWAVTYALMSACVTVGIVSVLLSKEPLHTKRKHPLTVSGMPLTPLKSLSRQFDHILLQPFRNFIQSGQWVLVLPFILFFKIGDTVLNTMSMPFLIEIGFSKVEIAHVAKTFGISAMVLGGALGGVLLNKYSLRWNLILCTTLQLIAGGFFMMQANMGHHIPFLFMTMGVENLTCGLSQVALISYLSSLCEQPNTATHYALLSSLASFCRVALSMSAGWLADQLHWSHFYSLITLGCLPALFVVLVFSSHFKSLSLHEIESDMPQAI